MLGIPVIRTSGPAIRPVHLPQQAGAPASAIYIGVHRHARSLIDDDEHECAETLAISEKFEHEAYDNTTLANDIALLRLASPPTCSLSA